MRAHEFRRCAFRSLGHLVPQRDGRVRVVTGAGRQLQADQVGFVFIAAAVGQGHAVVGHGIGQCQAVLAETEYCPGALLGHLDTVGLGHGFAAVFTQGVGDFMAHYGSQFVIGELEVVDQAAVHQDLAARPAVGVHLIAFDQVHVPVPLGRIRAESRSLGDQALGNGLHALGVGAGLVQHPFAAGFTQGLLIRLGIHLVDFLARQHAEHVLLALYPNGAAAGGIDRLTTRQQHRCNQTAYHQ